MTLFQLGWVVGFLEGEGSFLYYAPRNGGGGNLRVQAPQKELEPLERLREYVGGGTVHSKRVRTINAWTLNGVLARRLMETMRPHMSPRRRGQIDAALLAYSGRPRRDVRASSRKRAATMAARRGGSDPRQGALA